MSELRYHVGEQPLAYDGPREPRELNAVEVEDFNHRHAAALDPYALHLRACTVWTLSDRLNDRSNLGAFANRKLRQAVVLAAALPAVAVRLHGFGAFAALPEAERNRAAKERLKRANDRTAAQIMAEVLQATADSLELGEEVIIESTVTEGTRAKPGVEVGGNPTIAVGALFGKEQHRAGYGRHVHPHVRLLTMGNDVIEGTTKSVTGKNSSMTALFLTESGTKRHLPDIYVQRWMAGVQFPLFDPRETDVKEAAGLIAGAYGLSRFQELSAYFIERTRHEPPMDELNALGVATPFDQDGDLFPGILLGADGFRFPDGRGLLSMIGEIGGSAEWAVGVLPLVWRGGQALGMLTSQSALTRKDLSPAELWARRLDYTEEEAIGIQDARFEHKPWFTIEDILEDPFAGGVSAFGAISDNDFYPHLKGVAIDEEAGFVTAHVLVVDSLGVTRHWELTFKADEGIAETRERLRSPKEGLEKADDLEEAFRERLADERERERLRIFLNNEYYPGFVRSAGRRVVLRRTFDSLVERGALVERDLRILDAAVAVAPEWFAA